MKKQLLTLSLVFAAMAVNAQERQTATLTTYEDLQAPLYCVSENGKYAAGDFGAVSLLDLETGEEIYFHDANNEGSAAKGVTNDGTIVGQFGIDLSAPGAVLKKGATEWTLLTVPEGIRSDAEYCPQGVTPDGKYIIGHGFETKKGMYVPLLWTLQDNGEYTPEILPYPDTDIWGMTPQIVTCYGLSNDGTRAYGVVVDFTGFARLGIIYTKGADGTWKYNTVGEDWLINEGATNPGPQPQLEDYVTAEEGTQEYWDQIAEYDQIVFDWTTKAYEYAKLAVNPSSQISVNQNSMSGNGKWVTISTPEEVRLYNVDDLTFTPIAHSSGNVGTAVTNDGNVLMAGPLSMPVRSSYICEYGKAESGMVDLATWLGDNYNLVDENGNVTSGSLGLGTCCINPAGNTIVGWNAPMQPDLYYVSAVVRIADGGATSIENIERHQQPVIENGTLVIPSGNASVSIYDLGGNMLATFNASGSVDLTQYASGAVVVRVKAGKLLKTFKVVI